ncbi:MAG: heavy metal translocating P-type ATPase [Ruminococcaceae bacterium]|nr:heavy metal translocating P-type ATPase [Oscillospiraceae bacterium]
MKIYNVTGMSCAACSARVEKAVSAVEGVSSCSVSLLTNSMGVEGAASPEKIIAAVEAAGYGASLKGKGEKAKEKETGLEDKETPKLLRRLLWSVGFLAVLMYFSMGYTMWGFPLPEFFEKSCTSVGLVQLLLAAAVMVINQKFFIRGTKGLLNRSPNMDTLVALGSAASFGYSTYLLFLIAHAEGAGNMALAHEQLHGLYFESAAMILALITVGKMLEAHSKGKTTDALRSLMALSPKTATVIRDGKESEISIDEVRVGDIFAVRAGGAVPVDGTVIEGSASLDESALTGESLPVDKSEGDKVSAATVSRSGYIKCRAERVGEDTTLSQIIKMVSDAAATKAPIAKVADKVSGIFVPAVMAVSLVVFLIWIIIGEGFGYAIIKAISVLVISCPCALGLATPVAIMVGSGKGARAGILFKTAASLEEAGRGEIVVLDKTGTVTKGEMQVSDIIFAGASEEELLTYAYSLEKKSEHPLGAAIVRFGDEKGAEALETVDFETLPGNGLSARIGGETVIGGSLAYVSKKCTIDEKIRSKAQSLAEEGKTPLFFSKSGELLGFIAVSDTVKDDSGEAVRQLENMGMRVIMLTGDNEKTGKAVAEKVGIKEVIANVLPDGKEAVVRSLKKEGKVIMIGDGINDAPALKRADIGIAIGAGTDVAIDSADIVLVNSSLLSAAAAVRLSRRTLRNIHENLFWAFIYNVIGIPLAAGAFTALGIELTPMFGAAAMSLSSFCVVSNALRLNLADITSTKRDKKIKKHKKEKKKMEKTMKIEGMMCPHCEARVKKCLEELPEVSEAVVSHEKNEAVVILSSEISDEKLKSTVEAQGYKVL